MRRDDAHAALAGGPARRSLGDGGDEDEFGAAADGRSRSRRSACRVLEVPLQDRVRRVVADVAAMARVGSRPVGHDGRALGIVKEKGGTITLGILKLLPGSLMRGALGLP